ncbi:hypothetical protein [Flavobacterium mesophilum]|uniref:hypothetical protein n=1 Tax=Flavobacterium mesophilum TaxID=3143495 RepID=UPI0031DB8734
MNDIFSNKDFIITVMSLTISIVTILLAVMLYVRYRSQKSLMERYDYEAKMVELEYVRKNLELQLYDVSRKLEENENRWKDINHLVISSQNRSEIENVNNPAVKQNEFLKNFGLSNVDFVIDEKQVFMLTPFNDQYRSDFKTVREVCNNLNLNCIRGDEEYVPNDIFGHILKQIVKSRLIIANITGRNPNVLYELGVAHTLNKPTLIIAKNFNEIPFDLNNKRIVIYENDRDLKLKIERSILDMLISKII